MVRTSPGRISRSRTSQTPLPDAAIFSDVDLSSVNGLDAMFHEGPSTIGIDTIHKSRGKIPEVFLRGCGGLDESLSA